MHQFCTLDIHGQFVNVSLKCLKRSSQFIIHMSSFRSNIGAKQLVINVKVSRASKSLKSVALSYFNKCLDRLDFVIDRWFFFNSHRFHNFPNGTFTDFMLPPQCLLARHIRLARLCNDFTSLGFGQVGCLKFHLFPVAIHRTRGSRKQYE